MSSGCAVCKVSGLVLWVDCAYMMRNTLILRPVTDRSIGIRHVTMIKWPVYICTEVKMSVRVRPK